MCHCTDPSANLSEVFFFFFSSRSRHPRYWRDWCSDVSSSDLISRFPSRLAARRRRLRRPPADPRAGWRRRRSEERRGGKECRSRGSPYHLKKKKNRATSCPPWPYVAMAWILRRQYVSEV